MSVNYIEVNSVTYDALLDAYKVGTEEQCPLCFVKVMRFEGKPARQLHVMDEMKNVHTVFVLRIQAFPTFVRVVWKRTALAAVKRSFYKLHQREIRWELIRALDILRDTCDSWVFYDLIPGLEDAKNAMQAPVWMMWDYEMEVRDVLECNGIPVEFEKHIEEFVEDLPF